MFSMKSSRGFGLMMVVVGLVVVAMLAGGGYILWQKYIPVSNSVSVDLPTPTPTSVPVQRFFYTSSAVGGGSTKLYVSSVTDYTPHLVDTSSIATNISGPRFVMSPDGKTLAVEANDAISLYSTQHLDMSKPMVKISSSTEKYLNVVWSRDSQHIAYLGRSNIVTDPQSGAETATVKIYTADSRNQHLTVVKSIDQTNDIFLFAVDGDHIYWSAPVDGGYWVAINKTPVKGGNSEIVFDASQLNGVVALTVKFNADMSLAYGADQNGNIVKIPAKGTAEIIKKVASDNWYYSSLALTPDGKAIIAQLMTLTKGVNATTNKVVKIDLGDGQETTIYDAAAHNIGRSYNLSLSPDGQYLWMAGNNWYQTLRLKDTVVTTTYDSTQTGILLNFIGWTKE